jgi:hypothetical protein
MYTDEKTKAFYFEPHDEQCEYYLFVLAEAERQEKPSIVLDFRP